MSIDGCTFKFDELALCRLPELMRLMRASMEAPQAMSLFAQAGSGGKSLAKKLNLTGDFPGCYVLIENGVPFYVGISRKVLKRLRQHVLGKTHFDASLAYRMASAKVEHKLRRKEAMKESRIQTAFNQAQQQLRSAQVAFIKIENDLEIYLFEAYCAIELDTFKWNTFRTH